MRASHSIYEAGFNPFKALEESPFESATRTILESGRIQINGSRPWDLQVLDPRFYPRVFAQPSIGLGESYMEGWWEASRLDEFFFRIFRMGLDQALRPTWKTVWAVLKNRFLNHRRDPRAFKAGNKRHDLGNDLFERMLDTHMAYSCGYWKGAANLEEAQEAKLDLICRKIGLKAGQHVLDVGGGWGSFAKFAAERYGARVTAITLSRERAALGRERCKGLPVEIKLQDYRDLGREWFDHIVSISMFEHVGAKNHRQFMEKMRSHLDDEGLFLLHTMGSDETQGGTDPWFDRYIFPNSLIPSPRQINAAMEGFFVAEDWHNIGADYDKTLMAWFGNFDTHWSEIKPHYGEKFYRMWKYYLLQSAALFRARRKQVWQVVLSPKGVRGGYEPVR